MNVFFFLLSFSRSGSTLLANLLNNHPKIGILNETWVFPTLSILGWDTLNYNKQRYILYIYNKSLRIYDKRTPVPESICERNRISFLAFYKKIIDHNFSTCGTKNPVNILHFPYLKKNVSGAKFIFLTRNPIAIANSHKNRWFNDRDPEYFLLNVTSVIKTYFFAYQKYFDDKNMITVKYEDIIERPVESLSRLCDHLGLSYDSSMLDDIDSFMFTEEGIEHHKDLTKDIQKKNLNKYRIQLSENQIDDLSYLLRDVIDFFNYPRTNIKPSKLLLSIERRVNSRLRYNRSFISRYLRKIKYYLFYLRYTIKG